MNGINQLLKRLQTRTFGLIFSRVYTILNRYGLGRKKYLSYLQGFKELIQKYHFTPTLPVTASVVRRHPKVFQELEKSGIELAVHGYKHIDYTEKNKDEISEHLEKANDIFISNQIEFQGFRFPYLKRNEMTLNQVFQHDFLWDSSEVISWPLFKESDFSRHHWETYQLILETYDALDATHTISIPKMVGDNVEIPVSVPDDDIIIERLGITDPDRISEIWNAMLDDVLNKGEMLVIQAHPERFQYFKYALEQILLRSQDENIWVASLNNIALWWKEKLSFHFNVHCVDSVTYEIEANCTEKAVVRCLGESPFIQKGPGKFKLTSRAKPIVGVHPVSETQWGSLLRENGFPWEASTKSDEFAYYIERDTQMSHSEMIKALVNTSVPLIMFERWPENFECCVAITGDIDGLDIIDFWDRFYGAE